MAVELQTTGTNAAFKAFWESFTFHGFTRLKEEERKSSYSRPGSGTTKGRCGCRVCSVRV